MDDRSPTEKFWDSVEKTDGCWNWTGATTDGYGRFWAPRHNDIFGPPKRYQAHRWLYERINGPVADDIDIDHICHNTRCVRPSHLRTATRKQNLEHRVAPPANNSSGVRGVSWHKRKRKWRASVGHNGRLVHIGYFDDLAKAAEAVRLKRIELHTRNDKDRAIDVTI